jgi:hypothetical protein
MARIVSSMAFHDLKDAIVTDFGTRILVYDYQPLDVLRLDGKEFVVDTAGGDKWFVQKGE